MGLWVNKYFECFASLKFIKQRHWLKLIIKEMIEEMRRRGTLAPSLMDTEN